MTQGELEQIPQPFVELMSDLEMRIMKDYIERIKANGFSPASADWEISRLQQLGESEEQIRKWIKETLEKTDDEVDKIFSDDVYREYYGHDREYQVSGFEQIPLEQNVQLLQVIEASKRQTKDTFKNLTGSTGFAIRDPATGNIMYSPTMKFYQQTLDAAIMDIKSGAFSYNTVLQRTINMMTTSGLRWIDYDSGCPNRVDVAARRAVMTGFRQVQGKINEQVAEQLQTDTYEVTYHVGARPTHQPWQGRVWTMQQLIDVCGLGTVTGLHGANCYHDYKPFIPGVSVRTYTDEQLDQMIAEENTPKEYLGKKYTTYEALQAQRRMETRMRKTRQDIRLMQDGGADPQDIVLKKAKYQGQMQTYKAFSEAMELPEQMERVYQDGLRGKFTPTKSEKIRTEEKTQAKETIRERRAHNTQFAQRFEDYNLDAKDTITTRKLMNNLNRTEIGRSTVEYLVEHPEIKVYMCYGVDHESGTRGYQEKNDIMIFASETKTVQVTAETLIHEITHHKYNIGESQWAESVCFAQELKNRMGKSQLTVSELRNIIKTVKELYPELPWRYKSES